MSTVEDRGKEQRSLCLVQAVRGAASAEFKSNNKTSKSQSAFYYHSALALLTKTGEEITLRSPNISLAHVLNNCCRSC